MMQARTAAGRRTFSRNRARLQARPSRHALASRNRRDPRRFGSARAWIIDAPATAIPTATDNFRLFARSFGAAFLFVSVLIA